MENLSFKLNSSHSNPINYVQSEEFVNYRISNHIALSEISFDAIEPCRLRLSEEGQECLYFIYNFENNFSLSYENDEKITLKPLESTVFYDKRMFSPVLYFQAGKSYKLCVLKMIKSSQVEADGIYRQLESSFKEFNEQQRFIYLGIPNLQICDYIGKLLKLKKQTLSNNLKAASYIYMIMSLKLTDYTESLEHSKSISFLSLKELQEIHKLSDQIVEKPENQYTIEELCRISGLSILKLQQGFKDMHQRTVANFITHTRLNKAEELMKTTNLNISEIVYSIGWTSRSYFSKIFKKRFNCTPNSYKQKIKLAAIA